MRDLFVTGTDTGVGKTVLSATLVIGLEAAYWKPIQSGRLGGDAETDRESVEFSPEKYPVGTSIVCRRTIRLQPPESGKFTTSGKQSVVL